MLEQQAAHTHMMLDKPRQKRERERRVDRGKNWKTEEKCDGDLFQYAIVLKKDAPIRVHKSYRSTKISNNK